MLKDASNITIVVLGKFHAFDIALELQKQNRLNRLISSMPMSVARKYDIELTRYRGLPIFEVLRRVYRFFYHREQDTWLPKLFTKVAMIFIHKSSQVIIGYTGNSFEIFGSPKFDSCLKILDKASTHTLSNIELISAAAKYHNKEWKPNHNSFVQRELLEYGLANIITVPSSFVLQTFVANGVEKSKLLQIPYAVSEKKFENLQINNHKEERAVLFVGQISARKGVGVLINAMEIVRQTLPDVSLWLVGATTESIDETVLNKTWIKRLGILRGQDLYDKYMQASIFCLLSFEEGLALVLTEAIQCNLPIVATENTGARDLIDDGINGFIVPLANEVITAETIINVLNKVQFGTTTLGNYDNIIKDLTWRVYTQKLLKRISEL